MRVLVLDLLTLARLDAQHATHPEVLDLSEAVAAHLDEGLPGMREHLDRQLPPGVLATVDRNALATIVRNLLVNAAKYAPARTAALAYVRAGRAAPTWRRATTARASPPRTCPTSSSASTAARRRALARRAAAGSA